ncbi:MAG: molybdenum cofactor guanylyltransferase, partial [Deltaproteobacteria bacterium]
MFQFYQGIASETADDFPFPGQSFRTAACPERVQLAMPKRFSNVAGVILAGGESNRMGRNKALLEVHGERMIETAYRRIAELFDEVLLVTNSPEVYDFIPCRKIADIYTGMGPLGGIHAALSGCTADRAFVTACD